MAVGFLTGWGLVLVSAEEVRARRIAQEKRQKEAKQRVQEAAEHRRIEGNKILADRLTDTLFRAQSASEQLAYWDLFHQQYPEIDIGSVYANLSHQYGAEIEQAKVQEQLADLQQRTTAAEARALRAEQAAEEAYWARPTVTYVPLPWIQSYPNNPSPPVTPHTVTHPHPFKPTDTIPPEPHKITPVKYTKPEGPINPTGETSNVKSGVIFKH